MLLFTDGFENFDVSDLWRKWCIFAPPSYYDNTNLINVTSAKIDTGYDPLIPTSPVSRKGGRSLFLPSGTTYLATTFRKSRTIYLGIAIRAKSAMSIRFSFCSRIYPQHFRNGLASNDSYSYWPSNTDKGPWFFESPVRKSFTGPIERIGLITSTDTVSYVEQGSKLPGGSAVAICTMGIEQTRASFSWSFNNDLPAQIGYVNHNANAFAGGFYYYQIGLTTLGCTPAEGLTSWVDCRIGNRLDKRYFMSCQTCDPEQLTNFYINSVMMKISTGSAGCHLDDAYIANDEGDVNNDFLGAIFVRNSTCMSQGTVNNGIPVNISTGNRGDGVSGDLVAQDHASWSTATDVETLQTEKTEHLSSNVTLDKVGLEQRFLMTPINFNGAQPHIKGVVVHAAVRSKFADLLPPTLKVAICPGSGSPAYANLLQRAIANNFFVDTGSYGTYTASGLTEIRSFVIENSDDVSAMALDAQYLSGCEVSFALDEHTEQDWYPHGKRTKIVFDELVNESLPIVDDASRYHEEVVSEILSIFTTESIAQWGRTIDESLVLEDSEFETQAYQHLVDDTFVWDDSFYDFQIYINDFLSILEDVLPAFHVPVEENFAVIDSSYGFWVEELVSVFYPVCSDPKSDIVLSIEDNFVIIESDVWDNAFYADEELVVLSSDVWDNHLDAESFAHFDEYSVAAISELVEELFGLIEDHFDGYWVEQWNETLGVTDSVLTQQWRYEWFMGVLINSWQINPVEQPGNDGDHTGDYDPEIFGG